MNYFYLIYKKIIIEKLDIGDELLCKRTHTVHDKIEQFTFEKNKTYTVNTYHELQLHQRCSCFFQDNLKNSFYRCSFIEAK